MCRVAEEAPATLKAPTRTGPVRLMLVDDKVGVGDILRSMLIMRRRDRVRDYSVEQVKSVAMGLAAMQAGLHDCYLVDFRIGHESGLDLVRHARSLGLTVPIVMLTGSDMVDQEAADAGANDFLIKGGFDLAVFERTVRYARSNAESLRRLADLNASLEAQVAERTQQYALANSRLLEQIAARENAERALLRTERLQALGRMTSSVAHDFNNILTALFSSLELLERRLKAGWGDVPDPRLQRPLSGAIEASRLGERMVEGLLAFARSTPIAPSLLDVGELITATERLLRLTLGGGVALQLVLAPGPMPIRADRDQFERALLNLASNARDAMHGQQAALLSISTERIDGATPLARISIVDNGPGMTRETIDHAFEPFFSTKPEGQGTGLGLAQVYGFAQQSGGEAALESEPGQGVRVTLTLPIACG